MSDSRNENYDLNGVTYELGIMPPTTALPVATKLANIIGSGAGGVDIGILVSLKGRLADKKVINAIMGVLKSLEPTDMLYIASKCCDYIWVKTEGERVRCNMDQHFNGKILDLLKVLCSFLKHNFKDFFSESLLGSTG